MWLAFIGILCTFGFVFSDQYSAGQKRNCSKLTPRYEDTCQTRCMDPNLQANVLAIMEEVPHICKEALRKDVCKVNCPAGWETPFISTEERKRSCYKIIEEELTWKASRERCKRAGGDLVSLETEEEQQHINNLLSEAQKRRYWTSGRYHHLLRKWTWEPTLKEIRNTYWVRILNAYKGGAG